MENFNIPAPAVALGGSQAPDNEDAENATTPLLSTSEQEAAAEGNSSEPSSAVSAPTSTSWIKLMMSPLIDDQGSFRSVFAGFVGVLLVGFLLGLCLPKNPDLPMLWYRTLSNCIGYTYFMSWSISFYPQLIANVKRRTTQGLSADFCALNVLGFGCYTFYNVAFYSNPTIHKLYKERYGADAQITVQSNDVAFAVHALVVSSLTLLQIGYYDGFRSQRPSPVISKLILAILLVTSIFPLVVYLKILSYNWLDYLYLLSSVKILVSFIKYIPQVILNYHRKSTVGWSIWQILLDFNGGSLSDLQLVLDCWALQDYSGITGNLAKLCLGSVSIVFDIVFLTQHYCLYPVSASSSSSPTTTTRPVTATTTEDQTTERALVVEEQPPSSQCPEEALASES